MFDEQTDKDASEKSEKLETLKEPSSISGEDFSIPFQAVDISSFREKIESLTDIQLPLEKTTVTDNELRVPLVDRSDQKVEKLQTIMSYFDRNKYTDQTRKERNVIAVLKKNGYVLLRRTGGSHQRWSHPSLPGHNPIILSTKSGGDLVHCRTIKQIEEQLNILLTLRSQGGSRAV